MPMIVTHNKAPVMMCPSASQMPAKTSQMRLPTALATPASRRRMTVRPKGHRAYPAIRNDAMPNGIVTMRMQARIPKKTYAIAIHSPDNRSHRRFSSVFMTETYCVTRSSHDRQLMVVLRRPAGGGRELDELLVQDRHVLTTRVPERFHRGPSATLVEPPREIGTNPCLRDAVLGRPPFQVL